MSSSDWTSVGAALLGSWPSQVSSWGKSGIAAYLAELEARDVAPAAALVAIRSCGADQNFPPSAPELAGLARNDPSRPTPDEAIAQIYGPGGILGFKRSGVVVSPWVSAFAEGYGLDRLRLLEVDDPELGGLRRRELRESYERFLAATDGRELAQIARGSRGRLRNPFAAVGAAALEAGDQL